MVVDSDNVGIAFALVTLAGASTAIGASVVFFPALVKLASKKTLAGGLGLSAGVMTYVSFAEIFQKSVGSFEDAGYEYGTAYLYATLCFFAGVIIMVLLNLAVAKLLGGNHSHGGIPASSQDTTSISETVENENEIINEVDVDAVCACCDDDPAGQLDRMQRMAAEMEARDAAAAANTAPTPPATTADDDDDKDDDEDEGSKSGPINKDLSEAESKRLSQMSLNTAIAIALHNFPEGLATFVATLADPKVGMVLAIAIAIHNVPEGLCVAMPVYYATGNRWKAFWWGVLSGVSEPVAAIFGYLVLASSFSDTMYAALFGMVAGMMVIISVRELLPTAHRYDPKDAVVTFSFIGGMGIMAISLVLFLL